MRGSERTGHPDLGTSGFFDDRPAVDSSVRLGVALRVDFRVAIGAIGARL